jgi:hypothetical protein
VERLLRTLEANTPVAPRDVDVAAFDVPAQSNGQPGDKLPDGVVHLADSYAPPHDAQLLYLRRFHSGRSSFGPKGSVPPGLLHGSPGGNPQDEDRRQPEALKEAANRLENAGIHEVARSLRELAADIERKAEEKHERMRQRHESPHPPIHELHEQIGQIRRDMHKLSEQMEHLTNLIEKRSKRGKYRHHREETDDDDDEEHQGRDDDDDDDDDEHHERNDRDDDDDE